MTFSVTSSTPGDNNNQTSGLTTAQTPTAGGKSNIATLGVNCNLPVVTLSPASVTLNVGDTASFTAAATGIPTPTVQWEVSTDGGVTFTDIPGATSATLSFIVTAADNGNHYVAKFSNACGSVTTDPTITLRIAISAFQIRYFSVVVADAYVNLSNTGDNIVGGGLAGGNICANVYVFDPNEEQLDCCSCVITPNALQSLSVKALLSNNITPENPTSGVIEVLASTPASGVCDPTSPGSAANPLSTGLQAWATTVHQSSGTPSFNYGTETRFASSQLSQGELNDLINNCVFIQANGSGSGRCSGCSVGGR